eukprot:TRINITY_DN52433_c0_g1_i1.p2 TRINITY_DN52433_c0_g1~~TRINITY_DN52433_c0_g1_i1.p2  ORF type:complete len:108 (-),score=9.92 TRINITY_DN52433_c0_g1_i1:23-346(-)
MKGVRVRRQQACRSWGDEVGIVNATPKLSGILLSLCSVICQMCFVDAIEEPLWCVEVVKCSFTPCLEFAQSEINRFTQKGPKPTVPLFLFFWTGVKKQPPGLSMPDQ